MNKPKCPECGASKVNTRQVSVLCGSCGTPRLRRIHTCLVCPVVGTLVKTEGDDPRNEKGRTTWMEAPAWACCKPKHREAPWTKSPGG